ncbi:CDP-glycerol glycerophosphotransferase family protein (plasmid) [Pontibacillus sp. ALD_SL1]|uniref:CDP-glycerol glycerophosphotransferase family protein n=1 Tax=Pontibacillus sp. ALD_SL1 TaxID=2777185 RepID=UPI001A9753E4|nr:CDP-glycerol glycerophosphotransferase family protein [Pontibacillus sp. ALD_SL1]QST03108.1 CDP-glycerol glycerophosphotransferase family protein [Pontibacillus sp. ALD_SL1]
MRKIGVRIRSANMVQTVFKKGFSMLQRLPKQKLVMFESFNGRQYSDSPRAIYEYMKKNHSNYKLVWSADRRFQEVFKEKGVPYAKRFSLKWLFLMPRAKYWVTNSRFPLWFPKDERTVYLQTWHGTPLKKLGIDIDEVHMPGTTTEKYKQNFLKESSKWDYLISPNPYSSSIFKRAFGFNGAMLETGYPRNDDLIHRNTERDILEIKEKLGIDPNKRVLLYAPTWRDNEYFSQGRYKFSSTLNLQKMKEACGENTVLLLRAHYLVADSIDLRGLEGFVKDLSSYEDIKDLYLVADVLLTDYSSVFFDYALLNRPILFFVPDLDHYRDTLRGFYFPFEEEAPGPLFKHTEDVLKALDHLDQYEVPQTFRDTFSVWEDGTATERVVEAMLAKNS